MLYTETVAKPTLELLKNLQGEEELKSFCLAGGTALALYLGHRKSIDLDLFTPEPFQPDILEQVLVSKYDFRLDFKRGHTLKGTIDGVKVDCIMYDYENLAALHIENGIRLYGIEDIIPMKLAAIADNGSRVKDFIDIAFLSTRFSFRSMLDLYGRKFPNSNIMMPLKAVTYFNDVDFAENIVMINGEYDWNDIRFRLFEMVEDLDKIFKNFPNKR